MDSLCQCRGFSCVKSLWAGRADPSQCRRAPRLENSHRLGKQPVSQKACICQHVYALCLQLEKAQSQHARWQSLGRTNPDKKRLEADIEDECKSIAWQACPSPGCHVIAHAMNLQERRISQCQPCRGQAATREESMPVSNNVMQGMGMQPAAFYNTRTVAERTHGSTSMWLHPRDRWRRWRRRWTWQRRTWRASG